MKTENIEDKTQPATSPPPAGLSRSDLLVLRVVAELAEQPGWKAFKADVIARAAKAWREFRVGVYVGMKGPDADRGAEQFMAEALARLVELRIAYPVLPDDERRRDPSFPAKAVTLGKRGFAIAAAVSESGDLQGRSGQTMAAHRRKILAAVLEAESEWERLNPSAAKRWREECEKYGGNGRPAPENLAAVVVEPKRLPADRKALNGIVRRLGKIDPLLRKFLGDGVSKVATGNPSLSLEELVRQLHAKKHPIAAPQQRAEQDST